MARRRTGLNYEKDPWRTENLNWFRKFPQLFRRDGKLAYKYVELLGLTGPEMLLKMESCIPDPMYFVGIDNNPEVLMAHVRRGVSFPMICGDVFSDGVRFIGRSDPGVGVLNLDTTNGVRPGWWREHHASLKEMVDLGSSKCPKFCLILNHTFDRGAEPGTIAWDRVLTHAEGLSTVFSPWKLDMESLLNGADALKQPGFEGRAGAFTVYKSKNHPLRMITVRLAFARAQRKVFTEDQ